jgi:hypothetical protein
MREDDMAEEANVDTVLGVRGERSRQYVREIEEEVRAKDGMAEEPNVDTVLGVPLQDAAAAAGRGHVNEITSMRCAR